MAALADRRRPQPLLATQPPHPPLADVVAGGHELVREEPVAELAIIGVQIDQLVDQVRVLEVPGRVRSARHW